MKRKILLTAMLLAIMAFVVPADTYAASGQERRTRSYERNRGEQYRQYSRDDRRGRRRYQARNRNTYGYRNYGQYRRTQVGSRRYRMARQYYWRNGVRVSRYTRVYY